MKDVIIGQIDRKLDEIKKKYIDSNEAYAIAKEWSTYDNEYATLCGMLIAEIGTIKYLYEELKDEI